ncbi:MAG: ABC transporter substrate-binding protein [Deltaproteobacteria bacterium]|nr:ABC transporter substrate-binding protein [Deltaproteobacteria bacterium]
MNRRKMKTVAAVVFFTIMALLLGFGGSTAMAADEIRIGFLAPMTGPLAKPGEDLTNGFKLFWDQHGLNAGGRPVKLLYGNSMCNPDAAMTQARRLIHAEKVHLIMGALCGHVGPAIAQVSRETGVPVLMIPGADELTKWDVVPTFIRTSGAASQIGHPFGVYLYEELGARNVTFIGQDYAWGHGITLGASRTFKELGGKVAKTLWVKIGTKDYGPVLGSVPSDTDVVVAVVVGADRLRLYNAWFNFGYDRKYKIAGSYWLHSDALPQVDDKAVGLIAQCNIYAAGIDTPENKAFVNAYINKYKTIPSWMAEIAYTTGLFSVAAIDAINGNVEDPKAFVDAILKVKVNAPRGPVSMDEYHNPVQNVYVSKVEKINHPVLGEVKIGVPVKTYEKVSQFWKWNPKDFLEKGPYKR